MTFIATYWYVWLTVMILGYSYALANQISRMKSLMSTFGGTAKNTFFGGIGKMFVSSAIGMGGMVLLIIAIIVNIIGVGD